MTAAPFDTPRTRSARRRSQRGQAMLLVVMLVGMVAALFVFGIVDTTAFVLRRDQDTAAAFANVKQALIGWSVQRTSSGALPNARPGELPCPDMNNDGFEDGNCAAGALGRVPWKTLGIPEPKDGAGETLWYAIAGPFRIWGVNANPINSDTKGNLTVYQNSTASAITTEAIAVLFAPGVVVSAQDHGCTIGVNCTTEGQCTTAPASLTPKCNPANYLETAATVNNSTTNGPFISAPSSDAFNDKLRVITTTDLMPIVEQRVARELLALLRAYRTAPGNTCNCYTWADVDFNNEGDNDAFRGWLPLWQGDPHVWGPPPADPGPPINLGITIPAWISSNDWWKVIYYAVAPDESQNKSGGPLTLDGVPGTNVILITPGPAPAGAPRPVNAPGSSAYWAEYLKDPENSDHSNNAYVRPSSTAYARNRLYTIP